MFFYQNEFFSFLFGIPALMILFESIMFLAENMAQIENRTVAAQTFLSGLRALPNFEDLRQKQYDQLLTLIRSKVILFEQVNSILAKLSEDIWGKDLLLGLKQALTDQVITAEQCSVLRGKQQDYRALPHYLNQEWFEVLGKASTKTQAVEFLVRLAIKLGLRRPSEPTFATLLALVFCSQEDSFLSEDQKWRLLQEYKPQIKKWLQHAPPVTHTVDVLSQDVECFPPDLLRNAYPDGFVPCFPSLTWTGHVCQEAATFPLRKTNHVATIATASVARQQSTADLSGVLDVLVGALSSRQPVEQQSGRVNLPGFRLLQPQDKPKPPQLALENAPVPPASQQATDGVEVQAPKQSEPQAKEPAAMIASLRAGLDGEKKTEAPEKKERKKREKKLKRPCAAPKAAAKAKAKAKTKGTGSKTREDMAEKRASLFRKIPKHLQDLYRGGCSSCRKRPWCTLSCWSKRGFHPDN